MDQVYLSRTHTATREQKPGAKHYDSPTHLVKGNIQLLAHPLGIPFVLFSGTTARLVTLQYISEGLVRQRKSSLRLPIWSGVSRAHLIPRPHVHTNYTTNTLVLAEKMCSHGGVNTPRHADDHSRQRRELPRCFAERDTADANEVPCAASEYRGVKKETYSDISRVVEVAPQKTATASDPPLAGAFDSSQL